jgi:hypothetical protein
MGLLALGWIGRINVLGAIMRPLTDVLLGLFLGI